MSLKPQDHPSLASLFGPSSREDWLAQVTKTLKGGDFQRRLVSRIDDGLTLEPIYGRRADAVTISGRTAGRPWGITARVDHPSAAEAASLAVADLEGGADGLALAFHGSAAARGFGLTANTVDAIDACLSEVHLDLIGLRIEPSSNGVTEASLIAGLIEKRRHDPEKVRIDFGLDPLRLIDGPPDASWSKSGRVLFETISHLKAKGFQGPFVTCDLRPFSEAGASPAQELSLALASGIAFARALEANGMPISDAYAALSWTVAIDADQFLGLAKLRALRRLWARIQEASGLAASPITIHAETAWRMMTRRDPQVNMLRATLATFTAATGGADSITVLPHTLALGLPDQLSRRIARNTQLILQEETSLWRVADPAAGSGAIESITDQLCETAWGLFQQIEREGGLIAGLAANHIQSRIETVRRVHLNDIATRRSSITGTSEFPSLSDVKGGILDIALSQRAATTTQHAANLTSTRLAEPFEALRDAADAATLELGARPRVFLANLGSLAEFGGRAGWITNLLAAGGIDVVSNDGFTASGPAAAAFAASGAGIACLCSDDATYELLAEATAMALKSAGAQSVLLAGKPSVAAAGIDQFLFGGQDVIAALQRLHKALGIAAV